MIAYLMQWQKLYDVDAHLHQHHNHLEIYAVFKILVQKLKQPKILMILKKLIAQKMGHHKTLPGHSHIERIFLQGDEKHNDIHNIM